MMKCESENQNKFIPLEIEIGKFPLIVCENIENDKLKLNLQHNELVNKLAGNMLRRLPWQITRRALAYYHVIFLVYTAEEVNPDLVLLASLYLASKVEDMPLCLQALLREFNQLKDNSTGGSAEIQQLPQETQQEWTQAILQVECEVLRLLCIDPSFELPFAHLKKYFAENNRDGHLLKTASCFVNDMFVTQLCLCQTSYEMAASALILSQKGLDREYVQRQFGVTKNSVEQILTYMKNLQPKIKLIQEENKFIQIQLQLQKNNDNSMIDEDNKSTNFSSKYTKL